MAGEPSLVSGIAGVLPAGPGGDLGIDSALQIFQAVKQIKTQQQQQAQQQLLTMLQLGEKTGMYPDEKEFSKVAKAAGVPIEGITAIAGGGVGPQDTTKMGSALQPKAGAQAATPPSTNAATKNPGGGVEKTTPSGTGTVEKGVAQVNPYQQFVERAQQAMADKARTAHEASVLESHVNQLKQDVLSDDPTISSRALGRLMAIGGVDTTVEQAQWAGASPEQRSQMINLAAGAESPAAREMRLSNQAIQLYGGGRYETLADARKAAEGQTVRTLPNLTRMADEARFVNELVQAGLSFDQAKDVGIKMANGVSMADALPKGVSSVVQQQLALQQRQMAAEERRAKATEEGVGIERERLGVERERIATTTAAANRDIALETQKLALELQKANDQTFNARFDNMINMERAGIEVPEDMRDNLINELAVRSGMTVEKVGKIWQWLTWSGPYTFKPDTSRDSSTISDAAGTPQKPIANEGIGLGGLLSGLNKKESPAKNQRITTGRKPIGAMTAEDAAPGIKK